MSAIAKQERPAGSWDYCETVRVNAVDWDVFFHGDCDTFEIVKIQHGDSTDDIYPSLSHTVLIAIIKELHVRAEKKRNQY